MQLTVKGKKLDVGDALREHVASHLTNAAEKYFPNPIEATVVFSKESNHLFKVDISIHVGKGIMLQSQCSAEDPYPAFDGASERVAKRMRRYKTKLKDHHKRVDSRALLAMDYTLQSDNDDDVAEVSSDPAIIAEMATTIQTMSVSDAVMRMDLGDLPAFMFKNILNDSVSMVYRRTDGNIGWVDSKEE